MTDSLDSDPAAIDPAAAELLHAVLAQADEIATLDSARAEAWASDIAALAAELDDPDTTALIAALAAKDSDAAATALAALSGVVDGTPASSWKATPPVWAASIGSSRCEAAWTLRSGYATSIAFRFVDAADERHVITVDIVAGPPESVGEVIVGPGDLLDALEEDDADIEIEAAAPAPLAERCAAALRVTDRPPMSAVVNGRLLLRRLATLADVTTPPPVFVEDDVPDIPERDPQDDAYALDVLRRATGEPPAAPADVVAGVAALVAPQDLGPFTAAQRDAMLSLEWADWLGAVIGLVRAGPGAPVDGRELVDFINRCPEVTTTIPKSDRARIEWAFDTVIESWADMGVLDDGALTELGSKVLPAALAEALRPLDVRAHGRAAAQTSKDS